METPQIDESTESLDGRNTFTTARLKANPAVADLAVPLDEGMAAMKLAQSHYEAIRVTVASALAIRNAANDEADGLTRRVFRLCQAEDGTNQKTGRVARYFPDGLNAVIYGPIADQPHEMRVVASKLESDEQSALAAFAAMLNQKAEALEDKVADHDVLLGQQEVAFGQVQNARAEWINKYVKVYGDLVSRLGKAKAETYFKSLKKTRKAPKPTPK
jgi:hypothetical protein